MKPLIYASIPVLVLPFVAFAVITGQAPAACQQVFNLPAGTVSQGVDASSAVSQKACEAYQYLYGISTKVNTADLQHINHLNKTFAICAAAYMKAYTQKYGETLQITSAWRSQADQERVSTSPTSNHTRGLAIDVHPSSRSQESYDRMRDFAAANKQFGVCFARPMYNGSEDRPHMTAAGIGSRTEDCNKYGISKMCDEGGTFDPNAVNDAAVGNGLSGGQTPTSGLSDSLRNYLGGGGTQRPATGAVPATGALPASSQPFSGSQPTTITSPSSGGSTGSTGVSTNPGVTTGSGSYTTAVPATIGAANVSNQLNSNSPTSAGTSTFDLLSALAGNTPQGTTTATGTPLALNGSLYQVQQLTQTTVPQQYDANGNPITLNPGTVRDVSTLGPGGHQTFTSQDLQYSPANTYTPPSNTTVMQKTLETLKRALLRILDMLHPFGYVRPAVSPEDAME